ncbi:GDP-D-glucose phosphorylase 1-like [Anneissia japonica]|uniref:GDP-D-glucose phosphorylase 1-like n=1 Tax=Anneissia japonica TaxID=1529436 RepID=UPI001425B6C0|nr:GDP-D-glucose phosphorylase 1-like [Anneissia japonica]XP_033101141.1 GDP-D-glucose phosphorylase 1-like [Anneissia japonica]XP_033101142.1 GDP-D-glucose phosphorylase 1-like [Anneissia japonica]
MEFKYSVESVTSGQTSWSEKDECTLSTFDKMLRSEWDAAMEAGCFRYTLDHIQTKILAGKYKFVAQLNTKRATDRRKAEAISSIDQPFNHDRFNFTKIKKHEILFEMKPVNNHFIDGDINKTKEGESKNPHLVVINISPLEYCNVLLVPNVNSCYAQVLNELSIQLALEMILISSTKSFRLGWNSLCAFASVNHLHFHAYYLEFDLYTEIAECGKLTGTLYETTDWPVRAFVLQLHGSDVQSLTSDIHKVTSYMHKNNIAHNLFLTRGECLDKRPGERTIRAYIWPRISSFGAKIFTSFNPAVCELAGHLPVKSEEDYKTLTEETAIQILKGVSLPDQQFEDISKNVQQLFK